jgi:uncharacterized membrane protein/mono/diheme cytochrome c family protein
MPDPFLPSPSLLANLEITPFRFTGRLHPIVVHFPIALVVLAAAVEFVRAARRERGLSPATPLLLVVAAASGVVAAVSGWLIAAYEREGDDSSELFGHRWLGTIAAVLLVGLAWKVSRAASRGSGAAVSGLAPMRIQTLAVAGLVGFAAHLGGEMIYGEGYLLKGLGRRVTPEPAVAEAPSETAVVPASLSANAALFRDTIEPIFAARCEECHGNSKRKGGLQLVPIAKAFPADGPDDREDWTIEPGDAAASLVVRRVELPRDDPDAMPPEGEPLTPEQISAIKAWIDGGAEYPKDETAPAVPVATSTDGTPARPAAPVDPKAVEAAMAAIAARGAIVQPLFAGSPLVEVNASLATPEWTDAELPLLDGLAGVLVNLNLARSGVTDAGVAALPPMPELVNLRLDSTAVGDAAVKAIAANPKLEAVNLVSTAVGDAGLAALAANRSVQRIYVWKSKVTASGRDTAERLRAFEVIGFEEPPPPKPEENPPETSPEPPAEAPKP